MNNNPRIKKLEPQGVIVLPGSEVSILDCANTVFPLLAKTQRVFNRGGAVVEIVKNTSEPNQGLVLESIKPAGFRSRMESCGPPVMVWRKGRGGKDVLQRAIISEDMARALLASEPARELLPPIASVTGCPVAIEGPDGNLKILAKGYHIELGGLLVTAGSTPPSIDINEAVQALSDLLSEFDFQSPSDRSRALAAFISPALALGGHIKGRVPVDVAEADKSQAGKGYRQSVLAAIYNESPRVVAKRGGVGHLDESFSQALIGGRPFIQLDNLRGALDSQFLEAFLTTDSIGARVPYHGEVLVDPRRFIILATSNGIEATRDLANRASFVRIRKREGHHFRTYPEGGLLEHVRARQPYFLGCVFSVVAAWMAAGKPKTADTRHDFREWAQTLDWIVQGLFLGAPLLDGHLAAQERVSNPALVFLRAICLCVEKDQRTDESFTASNFAELAESHGIMIPGVRAGHDEKQAAKQVGVNLAPLFKTGDAVEVDGFTVRRSERLETRPGGNGTYPIKTYCITRN